MTTGEIYNDFKSKLKTIYDDREAENIADWVFENVTHLQKWQRRENQNRQLPKAEYEKLKKYLEDLLKDKPVQYVLNEVWFYKRKFYVNENVLIPRPETEELVQWIVSDFKKEKYSESINIIDIGTGSGCIPISLKKELVKTTITAIDISRKALMVAKKNAVELDAKIDFFQIDFLKENEAEMLSQYDIIVSNPPYIPVSEKEILAKNVTEFEPEIALFVKDNDPFIFYKKIVDFAASHLKENGKIYVEVHEEYAAEVKNIFDKAGFASEVKNDIYGKERMIRGVRV